MARPASDISERILHAARARFLREGVDGASLRNVAADAGTSIGMVYYYYPTKDDLFLAVIEEVYARILVDIERTLAAGGSVEERFGLLYARMAAMSPDEADTVRLIVREALVSSDRLARVTERFSRGHIPVLAATTLQGVMSGELRDDLPPFAILASAMGLALLPQLVLRLVGPAIAERFGGVAPSPELVANAVHKIVFEGIRAAPRPAASRKRAERSANLHADDERAALKRLPGNEKRNVRGRKNRKKG